MRCNSYKYLHIFKEVQKQRLGVGLGVAYSSTLQTHAEFQTQSIWTTENRTPGKPWRSIMKQSVHQSEQMFPHNVPFCHICEAASLKIQQSSKNDLVISTFSGWSATHIQDHILQAVKLFLNQFSAQIVFQVHMCLK